MSIKPINTRRSAQPVERRTERQPLQRRDGGRVVTAQPLAPTFARLGRRRSSPTR
jgi:hypothetical protein